MFDNSTMKNAQNHHIIAIKPKKSEFSLFSMLVSPPIPDLVQVVSLGRGQTGGRCRSDNTIAGLNEASAWRGKLIRQFYFEYFLFDDAVNDNGQGAHKIACLCLVRKDIRHATYCSSAAADPPKPGSDILV